MRSVVVPLRLVVMVVVAVEVGGRHVGARERRAVVRDPPVAHDDRAVDERRHRAELVGDQHDRGAPDREGLERVGEHLLVGQVDTGGRLVEEEQLRLAGQSPGDQDPLLLSTGERRDAVAGPVRQSDDLERLVDGGSVATTERPQQPSVRESPGRDDLPDRRRYAGAGAAALGDEADAPPVVEVLERRAEEAERPGRQRPEPGQRPHQRGLAGAVGSHQRHELTGAHRQVDPAQDRPAGDRDGAVAQLDDGSWRVLNSRSPPRERTGWRA